MILFDPGEWKDFSAPTHSANHESSGGQRRVASLGFSAREVGHNEVIVKFSPTFSGTEVSDLSKIALLALVDFAVSSECVDRAAP
jgi:hypothetical protein